MIHEERVEETRRRLLGRLTSLRGRAFRRRTADARLVALASALGVVDLLAPFALLTSRRLSLNDAFFVGGAVFLGVLVPLLWRERRSAPKLINATRRLETLFHDDVGALLAALDVKKVGGDAMLDETNRRAERVLDASEELDDDELSELFFSRSQKRVDDLADLATRVQRLRRRRQVLQRFVSSCAALLIALLLVAAVSVVFHRPSTSDASNLTADSHDDRSRALEESESIDEDAVVVPKESVESPADSAPDSDELCVALAALGAELSRVRALVVTLVDDLRDAESSTEDAFSSALAVFREVERAIDSTSGPIARSADVAAIASANLKATVIGDGASTSWKVARGVLTTRYSALLTRELRRFVGGDASSEVGALRSGFNSWARGKDRSSRAAGREDAATAAETLLALLDAQTRAVEILTASWECARAVEDASRRYDALRTAGLDAFASRAGTIPQGEGSRAFTPDFFTALDLSRQDVEDFYLRYQEIRSLVGNSERRDFLDFARRVADDVRDDALFFPEPTISMEELRLGRLALLDYVESEAEEERWGRALTLLYAPVGRMNLQELAAVLDGERFQSVDSTGLTLSDGEFEETRVDALAVALAFGKVELFASLNISGNEDAEVSPEETFAAIAAASGMTREIAIPSETLFIDARETSALAPETLRALEREAALGETAALEGRAEVESRRDETARLDRRGSGTRLAEGGGEPDAEFSGGVGASEEVRRRTRSSDEAFHVELPDDVRERLQRVEGWNPDDERLQRAREYQRRLWNVIKGSKDL